MEQQSTGTNWLDVLRSAMWPLIVLLLIFLFREPVGNFLNVVSKGSSNAEEIEVGPLKLKISPDAARRLGPPDEETAKALANLTKSDLEFLVRLTENSSILVCNSLENATQASEIESFRRMSALGLVRLGRSNGSSYDWCPDEFEANASLSTIGVKARRYFIDIAAGAIEFSK